MRQRKSSASKRHNLNVLSTSRLLSLASPAGVCLSWCEVGAQTPAGAAREDLGRPRRKTIGAEGRTRTGDTRRFRPLLYL